MMNTRPSPPSIVDTAALPVEIASLNVRSFGQPYQGYGVGEVPERLQCYEVLWVKGACGWVTINTESHVLARDGVYLFAPGQVRLLNLTSVEQGFQIIIPPALFPEIYRFEHHTTPDFFGGMYSFNVTDWEELADILTKIEKEAQQQYPSKREVLRSLLNVFMLYLSRQNSGDDVVVVSKTDNEIVNRFIEHLRLNVATKKLVSDYADDLCISPNYLNTVVKRVTGFPASHHIQQYIIREAKCRALYSGLLMKEIAFELGFTDLGHFSKYFKTYSGTSFTSFLKSAV
jgi:AraC family transcriptional regulator, transcriptional activator of pobA